MGGHGIITCHSVFTAKTVVGPSIYFKNRESCPMHRRTEEELTGAQSITKSMHVSVQNPKPVG